MKIDLQLTEEEANTVLPALRSQRGCNEVFKANVHPKADLYREMERADELLVGVIQRLQLEMTP